MPRQRPPAALSSLITFCLFFLYVIDFAATSPALKTIQSEDNEVSKQTEEEMDIDTDEDHNAIDPDDVEEESLRKVNFPDLGDTDDPYTIIENSTECFWCDSDKPEDDDEYRAATIYTFSVYVAPGTCVVNKSPRYPGKYPNNRDYRWTYTTHANSVMVFTVRRGGLQISRGCHRDKLVVRVGTSIVKKCAQFYNFQASSRDTARMYVRFASNHRIRWHGYTGTICASELPPTTTQTSSTTILPSTATTTPPEPISCDDVCGDVSSGRISMPNDADVPYPWVATVDILKNNVFVRCSAYLISKKHLVTSAFCFFQDEPMGIDNAMVRVMVGEYDISSSEVPAAQVMYSTNVTLYDGFDINNGGGVYNMAMITMPGNGFTLNSRVSPICLANTTVQADIVGRSVSLYVTGFGWTQNDYPAINMTTATLTSCSFVLTQTDLICIWIRTAPSTPCHGDAGSAIYERWSQDNKYYAVAQINAITVDDCPLQGSILPCPAVSFYLDWINEVTGPRYCNND